MNYEVLKPFNTVNRRFAPGAGPGGTVSETDDVSPHTVDVLTSRKFIQAKAETAAAPEPLAPAAPLAKTAASRPAPVPPAEL